MSLTYHQSRAIDITQKTVSSISVLGECLVLLTFISDSRFRKPFNRLVFYATFGNIFSNLATIIGQSAIRIGLASPLCQFQAFLIQWLMPADALWIFAMAVNVWLTFFYKWDSNQLKSLEWKYILFCYGIPLIPAIVLLCIKTQARGRVYGNAVIWCWTSIEWDFLRIAVFYGPVWVIILLTLGIYVRVGLVIMKWRRQARLAGEASEQALRSANSANTANTANTANSAESTPEDQIRRTDEVTITRENAPAETPYGRSRASMPNFRPHHTRNRALAVFHERSRSRSGKDTFRGNQTNKATIRYCKCALLFFVALTIVWVPSTINRIWTLIYPEEVIFGLQYAAAFVLPLQGFCNASIYFSTSSYACKCMWRDIMAKFGREKPITKTKASPPPSPSSRMTHDTNSTLAGGDGVIQFEGATRADSHSEETVRSDSHTMADSEANTIAGFDSDTNSLKDVPTL